MAFRTKNRVFHPDCFPLIMGIINVTPDSFYSESCISQSDQALKKIELMIKNKVDIIDLGAESTRPGSERLSVEEELKRILPVIESVRKEFPGLCLSLDTYKAKVAEEGLQLGVEIINDISGLKFDSGLPEVLKKHQPAYVLMHINENPKTMQENIDYKNLIEEIKTYFKEKLKQLENLGLCPEKIAIDPGIGFGKTVADNLKIIKLIKEFKKLGSPVLIGLSRKSFMRKILHKNDPSELINATSIMHTVSLMNGADILRVHDPAEAYELKTLFKEYSKV